MMQQIDYVEVYPANGVWMVRFTSEPEKSRIRRVMGTNELPTPFTTATPFAAVIEKLRMMPSNARTAFVEAGQ